MVLLPRRVVGWIKGIDTYEMLKTARDEHCYFNTKYRSWQKEAACTCDWLTRLVSSGQAKERRKKNDGKAEEGR